MLILVSIIPTLRLLSLSTVQSAKQSVWLLPIIGAVVFLPMILMQCFMMKSCGYQGYAQLNDLVYGKIIGRIITGVYMVWAVFLSAYNIRLFAERISNTLFPFTDRLLFIGIMIFLCAYSIRMGITASFRTSSIFVVFVLITLGMSCLLLFNRIETKNLMPITSDEIIPLVMGVPTSLAILTYFILNFFFIDNVKKPDKLVKNSLITLTVTAVVQTLMLLVPIGMFGSKLAFKMNSPFFDAVKNINVFGAIEKMDAVIVVILILADFSIVLGFIFTALKALAHITQIPDMRKCSDILLILIFLITLSMAENYFNLKVISENIVIIGNIILGIIFPITLFITGKIRKVFNTTSAQQS